MNISTQREKERDKKKLTINNYFYGEDYEIFLRKRKIAVCFAHLRKITISRSNTATVVKPSMKFASLYRCILSLIMRSADRCRNRLVIKRVQLRCSVG